MSNIYIAGVSTRGAVDSGDASNLGPSPSGSKVRYLSLILKELIGNVAGYGAMVFR